MPAPDAKTRFSNRVADYVRYRPGYPDELVQTLQREAGLSATSIVADIGSGTGISASLFLQLGCTVYGIEPNTEMRQAAEAQFADRPGFHSLAGTAEATTLPDQSVNLIAAGQAFHWFDPVRTRAEFQRILRPGGYVALFWNSRRTDSTPFLKAYEELLLRYSTDYSQVNHTNVDSAALARFFDGPFQQRSFPSSQSFDLAGLRGRLMSSSYAPVPGEPRHEELMQELDRAFHANAVKNRVEFEYDTELSFGQLN